MAIYVLKMILKPSLQIVIAVCNEDEFSESSLIKELNNVSKTSLFGVSMVTDLI